MQSHTLQRERLSYQPIVPEILHDLNRVSLREKRGSGKKPLGTLKKIFPKTFDTSPYVLEEQGEKQKGRALRIGAVFSGGQAAGGHNVLAGIFHALKAINAKSQLFGFLNGPSGIIDNQKKELTKFEIASRMNQGGFDLIGTGRTKIETQEQFAASLHACLESRLDGLVVIGGDDSNTNAAMLAEYFLQNGCHTKVIGIPKTIDGDLRSEDIEIPFGFDSACKTYSETIGNLARDALSDKKYYHFIKLMGRFASHITLECAFSTHPNLALISEEKKSLERTVCEIADLICQRHERGKSYGVVLIPEGLIEFIPEIQALINALNLWITENPSHSEEAFSHLSLEYRSVLEKLGEDIQKQLLLERDSHGNLQVSQIDSQRLLINLVTKELKQRNFKGKFSAQAHFLGYEGRSCFPSNFDANYSYSLGLLATLAVRDGITAVICSIQQLKKGPSHWKFKMIPILPLMHLEIRKGKEKPVIRKTIVDLQGASFRKFATKRALWSIEDDYRYPGPMQFFGNAAIIDSVPLTL